MRDDMEKKERERTGGKKERKREKDERKEISSRKDRKREHLEAGHAGGEEIHARK